MKKLLSFIMSLLFSVGCFSACFAARSFAAEIRSEGHVDSLTVICETDKDPIYYNSGERVRFSFTVLGDGSPITVPELRYTWRGDDGTNESGVLEQDGSGKYIFEGVCMDIPGFMSLNVDAYGSGGEKWKAHFEKGQSYLFQGGILVNAFAIKATTEEPTDFDEFWEDSLALLSDYPADIIELRELQGTDTLRQYEVYINCYGLSSDTKNGDTFVAGYLSVPRNARRGSLKIQVNYQGQGLAKIGAYGGSDRIMFNCLAHSVDLAQLAEMSDSGAERTEIYNRFLNLAEDDIAWNTPVYGMSPTVNADRERVYYRQMLLRDYQAIEFLIKYFSESSTATEFDGIDISSWAGLWDGESIKVEGGSQGGFQAIGVAALHRSVTELSASIPWLCSIGSGTVDSPSGTIIGSGNRPKYAKGLDYVDTVFLAKRVNCKTKITAGMGDPTCPPSGTMAMFNNLVKGKSIDAIFELKQGRTHGYNPSGAYTSVLSGEFSGVTGWRIENGVLSVGGAGALDASAPEAVEWNKRISEVKEIRINGSFTHIGDSVFELESAADVYINCRLELDSRAFCGADVKIFVPSGIDIEGAISLGTLSKSGAFYYSMEGNTFVVRSAREDAVLELNVLDLDLRAFISANRDAAEAAEIRGKFSAVGKLKDLFGELDSCKSVKIDHLNDTLAAKQNFAGMDSLVTLGHWDFEKNEGVSYSEGTADLTGFKYLLDEEKSDYALPEGMLEGCKALKKVILPSTVKCGDTDVAGRIGKNFFLNCMLLEEVEIPESVMLQSIAFGVFRGCKSLKKVMAYGKISPSFTCEFDMLGISCYEDIPSDCKFMCADSDGRTLLAQMFNDAGVSIEATDLHGCGVAVIGAPDGPMPVWIICAVVGGALALAACAVVITAVLKKKR